MPFNPKTDHQKERMVAHARHIRDHKRPFRQSYWTQFDNAPSSSSLYTNETIFSAALEQDLELIELGVLNKVILIHQPH